MKLWTCVAIVFLSGWQVCLKASADAGTECVDFEILSDPRRDVDHVPDKGDELLCDVGLSTQQWYRFSGHGGTHLPTECVHEFRCGTHMPIWMDGNHPLVSDGIVQRRVCSVMTDPYCCGWSSTIEVRNCSGYYVYKFARPPGCYYAYCIDSGSPCSDGDCTGDYPIPNGPPILEGPVIELDGTFHFKCILDYPTGTPEAQYEVEWLYNGFPGNGSIPEILYGVPPLHAKLDGKTLSYRDGKLGKMLSCRVRSFYDQTRKSDWEYSDEYFVGIEVSPTFIPRLLESDDVGEIVHLWSTVPILCEDQTNSPMCELTFVLQTRDTDTESSYSHEELAVSTCGLVLSHRHHWDSETNKATTNFTLYATRDFMDDGTRNMAIQTYVFPVSSVESEYYRIFMGYVVDPIRVSVVNVDHKYCSSYSDPHYRTFDRNYYSMMYHDYFVLVRGKTKKGGRLEIQTATSICSDVSCNCAVAILEQNDLVIIDFCHRTTPRITVPRRKLSSGTVIHEQYGYRYYVYTHTGVLLEVTLHSRRDYSYMDITVLLPSDYHNNTTALCGTASDDRSDDFTKRDGTPAQSFEEFVDSWRVQEGENLFIDHANIPEVPDYDKFYCSCPGDESDDPTICCDFSLAQRTLRGTDVTNVYTSDPADTIEEPCFTPEDVGDTLQPRLYKNANQRDILSDYGDEEDGFQFEIDPDFVPAIPDWPTPSGITEDMAVEFCETFLLQSSVGEGCLNLTNIELDSYTDACVLDIQATDDKELVMSSLATMELECIDIVQRNITYYEEDENGDMVPPPDVVSVVCPNECSFRGQCVDNECSCNEGYTGDDCSLEEGAPPIVHNLRHELCDVRDRPCETAFVIGEKFTSSNNLTCRVQYNKANYNIMYDATALLLSFAEVSCLLLQPNIVISGSGKGSEANSLPVEYSTLSVSNDGEVYSEELLFTVYDSVCVECEDGGNCVKKVKSCLINGVCYGDGFQNQAYPYYICDADNDEYDWTFIGPDPTSGDRTTQDVVTNTTQRMSTPDLIAEVESPKTVLIGVLVGLVVGIAIASVVIYVARRVKKNGEVRNKSQAANSTAMQSHTSDSGALTTLGQPAYELPRLVVTSINEPTYEEIADVSNPHGIYVTTILGQKPDQAIHVGYSELPPPYTVESHPYTSLQDRKIDDYTKPTTKGMHSIDD